MRGGFIFDCESWSCAVERSRGRWEMRKEIALLYCLVE
jgi:hypothetical protein